MPSNASDYIKDYMYFKDIAELGANYDRIMTNITDALNGNSCGLTFVSPLACISCNIRTCLYDYVV